MYSESDVPPVWPGKQDASQVHRLRVKRAARKISCSTTAIYHQSIAITASIDLAWHPQQTNPQQTTTLSRIMRVAWRLRYRTDVRFIAPAVRH